MTESGIQRSKIAFRAQKKCYVIHTNIASLRSDAMACSSSPLKNSKLMICFLFCPNHKDTSLSPQLGGGGGGTLRNSWICPDAAICKVIPQTLTSARDLGRAVLKGSWRTKGRGLLLNLDFLSALVLGHPPPSTSNETSLCWSRYCHCDSTPGIWELLATRRMIPLIPGWMESHLL